MRHAVCCAGALARCPQEQRADAGLWRLRDACLLCRTFSPVEQVVDAYEVPAAVGACAPVEYEIRVGEVPVAQGPMMSQPICDMCGEIPVRAIDVVQFCKIRYAQLDRQPAEPAVVASAVDLITILPPPAAREIDPMPGRWPVTQKNARDPFPNSTSRPAPIDITAHAACTTKTSGRSHVPRAFRIASERACRGLNPCSLGPGPTAPSKKRV